jgi:DNA-binding CsgD family transcriptional regulator/GAF domain-containing protein
MRLEEEIAAVNALLPPWEPVERDLAADHTERADSLATLEAQLARLGDAVDPDLSAAAHRVVALAEQGEHDADTRLRERLDTLARVHTSLARLREFQSVDAIIARAAAEACASCGFDRAVVYQLRGPELIAESFHVEGHPDLAAQMLEFSRDLPLRLEPKSHEREMIRRRMPMCVHDAMTNPHSFHPQAEVYDVHSYVAAPIFPAGKVIGFVHADHRLKPRRVDELDRDALFAFAEGLGFAIERARLTERLRGQGDELRRLLRRADAVVGDYLEAEIELVTEPGDGHVATRTAEALLAGIAPGRDVGRLLSRREHEVMELLVKGASNGQIAAQLVIAEDTAKTHVKRILRKLGAANRVEAATTWLKARQRERP